MSICVQIFFNFNDFSISVFSQSRFKGFSNWSVILYTYPLTRYRRRLSPREARGEYFKLFVSIFRYEISNILNEGCVEWEERSRREPSSNKAEWKVSKRWKTWKTPLGHNSENQVLIPPSPLSRNRSKSCGDIQTPLYKLIQHFFHYGVISFFETKKKNCLTTNKKYKWKTNINIKSIKKIL